ncbi:MAG: ATP-binding protein [Lachnospiraceae bacterium]|nr:ATP-binding protein [Lachnospiraceae bacterium]
MSCKIDAACMKNYGILGDFQCDQFSNINLIIGENGTGKTYLLKSLYSMIRSLEEYKRGDNIKPFIDVLSEKLRWTFQVDKLGDMVTRSASESLKFDLKLGDVMANYQLTQSASNKVGAAIYPDTGKAGNSIFIPAKEVLSLFSIIFYFYTGERSIVSLFDHFKIQRNRSGFWIRRYVL